jgi:hypothetical protein
MDWCFTNGFGVMRSAAGVPNALIERISRSPFSTGPP